MKMNETPFEDLNRLKIYAEKIKERGKVITTNSDLIENRKRGLQNHIDMLDKLNFFLSDAVIDKYNTLTLQLSKLVDKRIELKKTWDNLVKQRNAINAQSEEIEKKYLNSDPLRFESSQLVKIELFLIQFEQVLKRQEQILSEREKITTEEERLVSESELLLGMKNRLK